MELIQSEQKTVPVEAEPRYVHQAAGLPTAKTEHGHSRLRTLAVILAALVLIVAIVFFARWLYHKTHHKTQPAPAATSQQSPAKPSAGTAPAAPSANNSGTGAGSSPQTPSTPSSPNSQVANTGPGNVVAIFIGTSLVAAGLHYIISVRRFAKTGI